MTRKINITVTTEINSVGYTSETASFLRNVCVALGNVGDASDLAALKRAETDSEPLIAEHAKWAIHQIRSRHGIRPDKTGLIQGDAID